MMRLLFINLQSSDLRLETKSDLCCKDGESPSSVYEMKVITQLGDFHSIQTDQQYNYKSTSSSLVRLDSGFLTVLTSREILNFENYSKSVWHY